MTFAHAGTQWPIAYHTETEHCSRQRCAPDTVLTRLALRDSRISHRLQHGQQLMTQPSRRDQHRCEAGKGDGWPDWIRGEGWPGSVLRPPSAWDGQPASGASKPGSRDEEQGSGTASGSGASSRNPSDPAARAASSGGGEQPHDSGWQQNWDGWDQEWDDWESSQPTEPEPTSKQQKYKRMASRRGPRDAYLRPMIDREGIRQRLTWNGAEGEDALRTEFEINQFESREAVTFAGILVGVPLLAGFILSRLIADPVFYVIEQRVPLAFAPTDAQKVEGARHVHKEELRLNMDIAIGRAPPLSDGQMQGRLRKEAHHLVAEFRDHNKQALLNAISDSTTGLLGFAIIAQNTEGRALLFRTISRVFAGLSDTAKAFIIIASTDILLGYHSEEGWTAAIRLILGHYGAEVEEDSSHIFVAIVPVVLDSIFKYWIFVGLNRQDPAATVTLKSMDRH